MSLNKAIKKEFENKILNLEAENEMLKNELNSLRGTINAIIIGLLLGSCITIGVVIGHYIV